MGYYKLREIRQLSRNISRPINENTRRFSDHKITVFLSHSHKDRDIIEDALSFLLAMNVNVYVDWLDDSMPTITSTVTADKIKKKIKQLDKFVVLLTENSKNSKWVPWELGYSDGVKHYGDIAILPILRNEYGSFTGVEYMELYPQIKEGFLKGIGAPAVFPPSEISNTGKFLGTSWLNYRHTSY